MSTSHNPDDDEQIPEFTREEMNIPGIRRSLQKNLNQMEFQMFEDWRLAFARWAYDRGKNPKRREGYAYNSMWDIMNRVEKFCEWLYFGREIGTDYDGEVIERDGTFTIDFTKDHLDRYWYDLLTNGNRLDSNRRTINNAQLVLKYRGVDWKIPDSEEVYRDIHQQESDPGFTDWHRDHELKALKAASLKLHVIPDREKMSEEEQDKWAAHLAQRLEKPKYELEDEDWETVNWKIPSLVHLSCDVGFRPCEIVASRVQWLHTKNENDAYLRIPREEDSKAGKRNRECRISPETARVINYWLDKRAELPEYEDTDAIWLTKEGNPYGSASLRRQVLMRLQREVGIDLETRENGWYMIRRGVGTDIINKGGSITLLMRQLRINRYETAERYVRNADQAADDYFKKR
ncbi:site-specific integrase [Haloarchaeobius sp. FL176]|uniref:site-specific integrase n=1 Tax=Haloarchaeobius sp. FL176 TaxID=2967129 RepID=UPI002147A44D|nr:site-specific integrase [Haloarchaeobius sp. FL176]